MDEETGPASRWRWVYDLENRTPEGSLTSLEFALGEIPGEPAILYFEAADPRSPTEEAGWCPDCKLNTRQLYDFVTSEAYAVAPVRLLRVIASYERPDWKDSGGFPNIGNVFRDPAKSWRLPGLPAALLVVNVEGQGPKVLDGVLNPDAQGLEYLRSRATSSTALPTERMLC